MFSPNPIKKFERLARDFPWIWAIKHEWSPQRTDLRVRYADESPLWGIPPMIGDWEIWLHIKDVTHERVVPLAEPVRTTSLARQIRATSFRLGGNVQHVAMILSNEVVASKDVVNIYRPRSWGQEPARSFERFLENTAFSK